MLEDNRWNRKRVVNLAGAGLALASLTFVAFELVFANTRITYPTIQQYPDGTVHIRWINGGFLLIIALFGSGVVGALPALFFWLGKRRRQRSAESEQRFEEACDWRDKHRTGELSVSDLQAWRRWISVPENNHEYHRLTELGAQLRQLSRPTLE
jgi:hypothetical protein